MQGNSVAPFDLPALVISPCEGFLKDRFLARIFGTISKCSQLLGLLVLVSTSASPWACVVQISYCWKYGQWRSSALCEAGLCDQGALWPCSPVMPGHSFAQTWQPAVQSGWPFLWKCSFAWMGNCESQEQGQESTLLACLMFFLALLLLLVGGERCWAETTGEAETTSLFFISFGHLRNLAYSKK